MKHLASFYISRQIPDYKAVLAVAIRHRGDRTELGGQNRAPIGIIQCSWEGEKKNGKHQSSLTVCVRKGDINTDIDCNDTCSGKKARKRRSTEDQ